MGLKFLSTGAYLPEGLVDNSVFEEKLGLTSSWIEQRTGISTRHISKKEDTSSLAIKAGRSALEGYKGDVKSIRLILVASFTSNYLTPSLAALVQEALGLGKDVLCLDVNGACSGFVYASILAEAYLRTCPEGSLALVIGAEVISKVLDFSDRSTCLLFGDGAGAILYGYQEEGLFCTDLGTQGSLDQISCPGINLGQEKSFVHMEGQEVFRFAIQTLKETIKKVCIKGNINLDQVDYFLCHQANLRILESVEKKLKIPKEKLIHNIERVGNTSAASLAILAHEAFQEKKLQAGNKIIMTGFGAGLSWGSILMEC